MSLQLPPSDQQAVDRLLATGHYSSIEEILSAGIQQLLSHEQLLADAETGFLQVERGEVVGHDAVFDSLRSKLPEAEHGS